MSVSKITKSLGAGSLEAPGVSLSTLNYDLPDQGSATQTDTYQIIATAERAGAELRLDLDGTVPDGGQVSWYLDGALQETLGSATPYVPASAGLVTAQFLSGGATLISTPLRLMMGHMVASHNVDDDAVVALVPQHLASVVAVADGDWSDPGVWDTGAVPNLHDRVLIPQGRTLRYDASAAPRLDWVRVDGALHWAMDRTTNMLVEHLVITQPGDMRIGDAVTNRLPAQFSATITISNRAIALDADAPTDLDLANDPRLIGRGLLVLGAITLFGHHRAPFAETAPNSLPLAGDTSVIFDAAPENWQVGDTIIIPGTAFDNGANNTTIRQDEERVITAISGGAVSFAAPLVYDHDQHNDSVTDRPDLTLPIATKMRNVIFRSESHDSIPSHQRGHTMFMHMMAVVDVWDAAFIGLGRTDKSIPSGVLQADGVTVEFPARTGKTTYTEPLRADSNLQSRYPVHGHFLGFAKPQTDLIRDCFVEDAKAWAYVHHGCRMDWLNCVGYRFQGSGMTAETADELGRWDNCLMLGMESTVASTRFPKGAEEENGKRGDFAFTGYGFFYRGRAMVVTRCVAIGCSYGHVFYHRTSQNGVGDQIAPLRTNLDVHDLAWLNRDADDIVSSVDYPITHFDRCRAIGCYGSVAVVKEGAVQNHDLNIQIKNFLGWAVWQGIGLNYIGGYQVRDVDLISTTYQGVFGGASATQRTGFSTGKTNQVAFYDVTTRGFFTGIQLSGIDVQGIANADFSQTDPRFMVKGHTSIGDTEAVGYSESDPATPTSNITWFAPGGHTDLAEPGVAFAGGDSFIIADFNGGSTLTNIQQPAVKTDSISNAGALPKPWDNAGLVINNSYFRCREIRNSYGYYGFNGDNILLVPMYFSDRLTARSIKQSRAIRISGDLSQSQYLGEFTLSATAPTCNDITRNVTAGATDSFNILTESAASGAAGTTMTVGDPHMTNFMGSGDALTPGTAEPAHFKPNYGKLTINQAGDITYTTLPNTAGLTDTMLVYMYDGQGRWCTSEITFTIS